MCPVEHDQATIYVCDMVAPACERDQEAKQSQVIWNLVTCDVQLSAITRIVIERGTGPPLDRVGFVDRYLPHLLRI
jgi:hypothetical protein